MTSRSAGSAALRASWYCRSASLGAPSASKLRPAWSSASTRKRGARPGLLERGDRLLVLAGLGQPHAELVVELGVAGVELDPAA